MGNQREIRQLLPSAQLGVAIPVRSGGTAAVAGILARHREGHFYTYLASPDEDRVIPNMDFGDTWLGQSTGPRFIIQSGGKMWCGYAEFCDHIASVAKYLEDSLFLVGDEQGEIDQFQIKDGTLTVTRVHFGYYRTVDDYIREHFPDR